MSSTQTVTSPPRGAPLKALGVRNTMATGNTESANYCAQYLWTFIVLLATWGILSLVKPKFIKKADGSLDYKKIFWVTLAVTAIVVTVICLLLRPGGV